MSTPDHLREKELIRIAQNIAHIRENMVTIIESIRVDAIIKRARCKALVNEGFTEDQAITLCK